MDDCETGIERQAPSEKVGLGNGLRLVCDKRNRGRYFELRKRVRGKDYSWGVGSVESLTIAVCLGNFLLELSSSKAEGNYQLAPITMGKNT